MVELYTLSVRKTAKKERFSRGSNLWIEFIHPGHHYRVKRFPSAPSKPHTHTSLVKEFNSLVFFCKTPFGINLVVADPTKVNKFNLLDYCCGFAHCVPNRTINASTEQSHTWMRTGRIVGGSNDYHKLYSRKLVYWIKQEGLKDARLHHVHHLDEIISDSWVGRSERWFNNQVCCGVDWIIVYYCEISSLPFINNINYRRCDGRSIFVLFCGHKTLTRTSLFASNGIRHIRLGPSSRKGINILTVFRTGLFVPFLHSFTNNSGVLAWLVLHVPAAQTKTTITTTTSRSE